MGAVEVRISCGASAEAGGAVTGGAWPAAEAAPASRTGRRRASARRGIGREQILARCRSGSYG